MQAEPLGLEARLIFPWRGEECCGSAREAGGDERGMREEWRERREKNGESEERRIRDRKREPIERSGSTHGDTSTESTWSNC